MSIMNLLWIYYEWLESISVLTEREFVCMCVTDQTLYPTPKFLNLQTPALHSKGSRFPKLGSWVHTQPLHPQIQLNTHAHTQKQKPLLEETHLKKVTV